VTVTLGRGELGVVCEAAVPLKPHNNEVDRIATAEGATRLDDILITRSLKSGDSVPGADTMSRVSEDKRRSAVRYRASIRMRYRFRFSAVTRNFPPASMPVKYHQDRFRSQPRNILVSTHCA